jgi:hypothetical protein
VAHYFLGNRSNKLGLLAFSAGALVVVAFVEAGFLFNKPPRPWIKFPTGLALVPEAFVEEPAPVAMPPI